MFMKSGKINVQEKKYFNINKCTGTKVCTGGKLDSKIINVPIPVLETREFATLINFILFLITALRFKYISKRLKR